MSRSTGGSRRRPSRIYAGIELSQPVSLVVPPALAIVAFAVWRVRSQYAELASSSGPRWDGRGNYEVVQGSLDKAELETSLACLVVGASACVLGIAVRWWRGRREWGDVPLGYGIGLCGFVYLIASWPSFHEQRMVALMDLRLGFPAALTFMLVLGFLSYMLLELVTRRARQDRRSLALLLAIVVFVPLLSLHYGRACNLSTFTRLEDGTALELDLPRIRVPFDRPRGLRGADADSPVYFERAGEPWLGWMAIDDSSVTLVDLVRMDADESSSDPRERVPARLRERLDARLPPILVALTRRSEPADLSRVARDAEARFPGAHTLLVLGSTAGEKPRGVVRLTEPAPGPLDESTLLELDIERREPHLVMDVLERGAWSRALEEWQEREPRPEYEDPRNPGVQLRLRVPRGVSLEELGAFYSSNLRISGVSVYLE